MPSFESTRIAKPKGMRNDFNTKYSMKKGNQNHIPIMQPRDKSGASISNITFNLWNSILPEGQVYHYVNNKNNNMELIYKIRNLYMYFSHIYLWATTINKYNILNLENQFYENNDFKNLKNQSSSFRLLQQLNDYMILKVFKMNI
ncbi:hypothetical protein BCR32DRAFT_298557 [Anaeromyces robustus]|uniref:Uncharacterized protein n=1 Tax=Anaeromyces robustus TaxID=1754192 RepID=A0A1Y1VJ34_9FUNG|nr:hypothetical protein BCR32DRAFT_298557 [Anaeromyces robustus]|eukprot:ORX57674.1 hypothetical protein BCR32DRAFT_298557 [Anaeromyces robustus]